MSGVDVSDGAVAILRRCRFEHNRHYGIRLLGSSASVVVERCKFEASNKLGAVGYERGATAAQLTSDGLKWPGGADSESDSESSSSAGT